jgi:site-specific DNA-methyltransferase (adenine-specific)/adenine-specific DNA-methyltransferase
MVTDAASIFTVARLHCSAMTPPASQAAIHPQPPAGEPERTAAAQRRARKPRTSRTEPAPVRLEWPAKLTTADLDALLTSPAPMPRPVHASDGGRLFEGDNLDLLRSLVTAKPQSVDLIYIDPPFCAGAEFKHRKALQGGFNDRWEGGLAGYLTMMQPRLWLMRKLLRASGSIYVHCDLRAAGALRVLLDEIFGEENLRGEIVWHYQSGGRGRLAWPHKHDTLLFYSRGEKWTFNADAVSSPRGAAKRNNMKRQQDADGRTFFSIRSGGKVYRYYEDDPVLPPDVWCDLSHLQQKDPERTGYATQKPLALLRRILLASSNPGDLIADFFCGSGTTLVAAADTGRRWLGCDSSTLACRTAAQRLTPRLFP